MPEPLQNLCLFDRWNPCRSIKEYRKLCKPDSPLCDHIRKCTLKPGDVEFYAVMDSNCYRETPYCAKTEGSQLRLLARWESPLSRTNNRYKKISYKLESLDSDALCFELESQADRCESVKTGILHVLPDYNKVEISKCANASVSLVKKPETALRRIPVVVKAQVWKDDAIAIAGKQQEFLLEVVVPPSEPQPPVPQGPSPIKVFISYAHEDANISKRLMKYFRSLKNNGLVSFWYDREIQPGHEWNKEIEENLNNAHIILLLTSLDFFASAYIESVELKTAIKRHESGQARVIPIIVRDSDWDQYPDIAKLLTLPISAKPISDYPNEDKWFTEVKKQLREVILELMNQ